MGESEHRLIVKDRGGSWSRRYQPSCSCGDWSGLAKRQRRHCRIAHRDEHMAKVERDAHAARILRPREPTPLAELPAELQPAATLRCEYCRRRCDDSRHDEYAESVTDRSDIVVCDDCADDLDEDENPAPAGDFPDVSAGAR